MDQRIRKKIEASRRDPKRIARLEKHLKKVKRPANQTPQVHFDP